MGMIRDYLAFHREGQARVPGAKTVTLMEVGSFYEMYETAACPTDLQRICTLLNILYTRRNKKAGGPLTEANPALAGFTKGAWDKYVRVLLRAGYTVVQVRQVTPPPAPKRAIVAVHSPATALLDESPHAPYLAVVLVSGPPVYAGLAVVDLSTGRGTVQESPGEDAVLGWIRRTRPRELCVVGPAAREHLLEPRRRPLLLRQ